MKELGTPGKSRCDLGERWWRYWDRTSPPLRCEASKIRPTCSRRALLSWPPDRLKSLRSHLSVNSLGRIHAGRTVTIDVTDTELTIHCDDNVRTVRHQQAHPQHQSRPARQADQHGSPTKGQMI